MPNFREETIPTMFQTLIRRLTALGFIAAILVLVFRRRRPQVETVLIIQETVFIHETIRETASHATAPAPAEATHATAPPTRSTASNGTHHAAAHAAATTPPFTTTRPAAGTTTMERETPLFPVDRCTDTIRHWDNLDTLGTLGLGQSPHQFGLGSVTTPPRTETPRPNRWHQVDQEPSRPAPQTQTERGGTPPTTRRRNRQIPWHWVFGLLAVGFLCLSIFLFGQYKEQEQHANTARVVADYWEDQYKSTKDLVNTLAQERHALCPTLSQVSDPDFRAILAMSNCSILSSELIRKNGFIEYQMDRSIHSLQDDPRTKITVAPGWTAEARIYTRVGLDTDTNGFIWNDAPSRKVYNAGDEFRSDRIVFVKLER